MMEIYKIITEIIVEAERLDEDNAEMFNALPQQKVYTGTCVGEDEDAISLAQGVSEGGRYTNVVRIPQRAIVECTVLEL